MTPRYWITNPAGHRAFTQEMNTATTGDIIDTPMGEAYLIDTSAGIGIDEWICDLCNTRMLSRFGDEPWPIATIGSDAICPDCQQEIEEGPEYSDRTGEPIPHTQAGPWPPAGCECPPCANTTRTWAPFILHAIEQGMFG